MRIAVVPVEFERGKIEARVVVSPEGKISGLNFTPAAAPARPLPAGLTERDVNVGEGERELPGTLTLPKGTGPFAGVVLVHGSGPQDRDETISNNKPFRDIAWGLAERGIAVLRYDKRTRHYGAQLASSAAYVGLNDETIDDAVAALDKMRSLGGIDPKRVFVLGHSLGGTLAPRILERSPATAGAIIVAGSTRPMDEILISQLEYLGSLPGNDSEAAKKKIGEMQDQARRIRDEKTSPQDRILGATARYWRELLEVHAAKEAVKVSRPLLVLQGERDYQVTMEDFALWKESLGGRSNATLKSYPKLNHLLIEGEGKSKPAEYAIPGRVSAEPLDDIVAWIRALRRP